MADEIETTEPPAEEVEETTEVTDADADAEGDDDETTDDKTKKRHKSPKHPEHASRQAARFRIERNEARAERDAARLELAFTKAAAGRFVDPAAAFKLADPALLSMDPDGAPVGLDEAIDALTEAHPFLLAPEPDLPNEEDPFKTASRSSGRVMNGPKKKLGDSLNRKALEARYPALRRG